MQNLLNELKSLLATQPRFTQEGRMIKQAVIDAAQSLDVELLQLLISHEAIKRHFFQEVGGVLVFDKVKLLRFVSNKAFLEDSYTAFKNKIGLVTKNSDGLYDAYLSDSKEVVLGHPYKDCMLEGGQTKEEETRKEIFWNEILAPDDIDRLKEPKAFSNVKRYDTEGVHENITDLSLNDNYIIKGNNLLALYSLLPVYRGKVKLIYIDPPYNTGNDSFRYNDSFNHSTWLTFMKDRLKVARELLSDEGSVWISIDDSECHYLKILLDEIFGRENFVAHITYERSGVAGLGQGGFLVNTTEHILLFKKSNLIKKENLGFYDLELKTMKRYSKLLKEEGKKVLVREFSSKSNGLPVKVFKHENYLIESISLKEFEKREADVRDFYGKNLNKIFRGNQIQKENSFQKDLISQMNKELYSVEYTPSRGKNEDRHTVLYYFNEELISWLSDTAEVSEGKVVKIQKLTTLWDNEDIPKADIANEGDVYFPRGKKPEQLLKRILEISTEPCDLVLDFHLGSGTAAAVAHKMKRRYIGIEQMDYIENISVERLKKVINGEQGGISKSVNWQGGGSFIYMELAKANQHFVEQIQSAETEAALLEIWARMQAEAFISYKVTPDMIDKNQKEYEALSMEDKKRFLIETLDKNLLYVPHCDMESKEFGMNETDKRATTAFYNLKNE